MNLRSYLDILINLRNQECFSKTKENQCFRNEERKTRKFAKGRQWKCVEVSSSASASPDTLTVKGTAW